MLKTFEWDVSVPTTITFGSYFAEFVVEEADFNSNYRTYKDFEDFKKSVKSDVMTFIDLSLHGN